MRSASGHGGSGGRVTFVGGSGGIGVSGSGGAVTIRGGDCGYTSGAGGHGGNVVIRAGDGGCYTSGTGGSVIMGGDGGPIRDELDEVADIIVKELGEEEVQEILSCD